MKRPRSIHVGELALPLAVITESVGILAVKRAGKSNTAKVLTEQLFGAGQQVVAVDRSRAAPRSTPARRRSRARHGSHRRRSPTSTLDAFRREMAGTLERAKADDPKALRKRIAELEREVAKKPAIAAEPEVRYERVEVPVVDEATRRALVDAGERVRTAEAAISVAAEAWNRIAEALKHVDELRREPLVSTSSGLHRGSKRVATVPARRPPTPANGPSRLGVGERTILTAIAQYPEGATSEQLTILTAYKRSSRDTFLQRLRAAGLVDRAGDLHVATDAGVEALGPNFEPLPTGDDLRSHWLERLGVGERAILEEVCAVYPTTAARAQLGEAAGYQRSSRDTFIQRLAARRLVEVVGRGEVRASAELFG